MIHDVCLYATDIMQHASINSKIFRTGVGRPTCHGLFGLNEEIL